MSQDAPSGFVTDKNPISMAVIGDVLRIASNKRIYAYRMGESDVRIELQDAGFGVINAMTEGKNDFWLGTNEGIFRYPGGNSPDNTSLADSRVVKLIPDGDAGLSWCRARGLVSCRRGRRASVVSWRGVKVISMILST